MPQHNQHKWFIALVVHTANKYAGKKAFDVINTLKYRFERMKKIYADRGYRGNELAQKIKEDLHCDYFYIFSNKQQNFK